MHGPNHVDTDDLLAATFAASGVVPIAPLFRDFIEGLYFSAMSERLHVLYSGVAKPRFFG